jgi:hypothetical protein
MCAACHRKSKKKVDKLLIEMENSDNEDPMKLLVNVTEGFLVQKLRQL